MQFLETPFKDPIKAKFRKSETPFHDPTKEQATTGRFMCAGDHHGVGFRQPVGKMSASNKGPIPREAMAFSPETGKAELK